MNTPQQERISIELREKLHKQLFEQVPCNIAIIDRNYYIVDQNRNFAEVFGDGIGKRCYEVYKKRKEPCDECMAVLTFSDGKMRVNDEVGIDRKGQTAHYIVHISPLMNDKGEIPYVVEMSTDVTESWRLKREYQILFERVPCFVAVLNQDLRIVRANERLRETFGETTGQHCYEVYKHRSEKCDNCPAELTFQDGKTHTSEQIGINKNGEVTRYVVTSSPLSKSEPAISHIIEIALDVTETRKLEEELEKARAFGEMLIENSIYGIIAIDPYEKVIIFNPSAERLLGYSSKEVVGRQLPRDVIPAPLIEVIEKKAKKAELHEVEVESRSGEKIPVRISAVMLERGDEFFGYAAFIQDLREIKKLEQEKLDAERLAVVGQTVAGLAHGVKNILTGLEGGMYVFKSGLDKGEKNRIEQGWNMLERNIGKISTLTKNLLSFSKGRLPSTEMLSPAEAVREVINLYRDTARQSGINIIEELEEVAPAPFDPTDLHSCLANLISNAIDACLVSEKQGCKITVRCMERDGVIIFEVADTGCGMDYEIKKKAFTNFFTTKGSSGTGLGLLVTRKITQEHGGKIQFESTPSEGSLFRLLFPRNKLPTPFSRT